MTNYGDAADDAYDKALDEWEDEDKEERETYQAECKTAPAEGFKV